MIVENLKFLSNLSDTKLPTHKLFILAKAHNVMKTIAIFPLNKM